ncbi:hypothetical protein AB1Y20_020626 [Prymnesium parvum]|uniref:Erythromycin biosynthesis protein CIII-like C-terminal domain-containing protein n=1 Tax=Prymnesium parvum TaxID=97485 RepID=A0AB34JVQ3_PRYPA
MSSARRVMIFMFGSRGDVQPLLALGLRLQREGYAVLCSANVNHVGFAQSLGVQCVGTHFDFEAFAKAELLAAMASGKGSDLSEAILKKMLATAEQAFAAMLAAARDFRPECLVTNAIDLYFAHALGTALELPVCLASLSAQGMIALSDQVTTELNEPCGHKAAALLILKIFSHILHQLEPKVRAVLGDALPRTTPLFAADFATFCHEHMRPIAPHLVSASPLLSPKPSDLPAQHARQTTFTGYWVIPAAEQQRRVQQADASWGDGADSLARLSAFLAAADGVPTVYIGWGSMIPAPPHALCALAVGALQLAGLRAVILGGWAELRAELLPPPLAAYAASHVHFARAAPHEWLFPRCAALVHHGGAGTAAASLRAGVPAVVTPCLFDQFEHARLLARAGAGIATRPLQKLTPPELAAALRRAVGDGAMRAAAAALGERLRAEDGVGCAAAAVGRFFREELDSGEWRGNWREVQRWRRELPHGGAGFVVRALCATAEEFRDPPAPKTR